jgi:hypothetical protein
MIALLFHVITSTVGFTQVDLEGSRNAHPGSYKIRFGVEEMPRDQGFLEHALEAY